MNPEPLIGTDARSRASDHCGEGGEVQQALAPYKKHINGAEAVESPVLRRVFGDLGIPAREKVPFDP